MNENMKRVIEAMEASPEKWGRGRLRDDDGCMCAMGFACDVYDPDGWNEPKFGSQTWRGHLVSASQAVVDWLGISSDDEDRIFGANDKAESVDEVIAYLKREGWKDD